MPIDFPDSETLKYFDDSDFTEQHMISRKSLLNMICTEAFEYGGIQEVPDHKHGADQNYASPKRDARGSSPLERRCAVDGTLPTMRYTLELVRQADGTLRWVE
jgi:hypothetical protein